MTARMIDEPHGTDRPQRWPLPGRHPYLPEDREPDPLPASAVRAGDCWLAAARKVTFLHGTPAAESARRFIDGLRGEDLWPRNLDARPEMLPAPAARDVTSVPVPDGNPGSGPAGTEVTHESPNVGESVTPCCGKTPFELPRTDRMTLDPSLVNCPSRPASGTVTHQQPGPGSTVLPCCGLSVFDLPSGSETTEVPSLATCTEASPVPERPAASAVAAEQGGGEGPAGQQVPPCPAGLAASAVPACPAGECNGYGEVEVGHHTCGAGAYGDGGRHEPGCGTEPCPAGCVFVPFAGRPKPSPVAAEVPVKPAEVTAAEKRAARSEP